MNKWQKILSPNEMPLNFVRFYAIGLVLFAIPFTRGLFINITAITLMLVIGVIFSYHQKWDFKTIALFIFIGISSFVLEMFGVSDGEIFGIYKYDDGLGQKLFETPLIIGLNWLFLVYATHSIATKISSNTLFRILSGAFIMLTYDLIIETVAPIMGMWHFSSPYPPLKNFITWFLAGLLFQAGMELFKINTDNKPARALIFIQLGFFLLIALYSFIFNL
jgi:uncharacterized membrane protein